MSTPAPISANPNTVLRALSAVLFLFAALCAAAAPIKAVRGGNSHVVYLKTDGTLWGLGKNDEGQLGQGKTESCADAVNIADDVSYVTTGLANTTAFIKTDGTLWVMGTNLQGHLGFDKATKNIVTPTQVPGVTNVAAVSVGANHTVFLKRDGSLWGMGSNEKGQLGSAVKTYTTKPIQIAGASGIKSISASAFHTVFVKDDGTVWGIGITPCGENPGKPFPIPEATNAAAVAAETVFATVLKNDGTLWEIGANLAAFAGANAPATDFSLTPIKGAKKVTAITAGMFRTLFLKADGTLWSMGATNYGAMGDGSVNRRPVQISGGTNVKDMSTGALFSVFLKSDNSIWFTGVNIFKINVNGSVPMIVNPAAPLVPGDGEITGVLPGKKESTEAAEPAPASEKPKAVAKPTATVKDDAPDYLPSTSKLPTISVAKTQATSLAQWQPAMGEGLAQMMVTELTKLTNFKVLESLSLEDLREERRLGEGGEVDEAESVKKGQWKGADYTLKTTVTRFGSKENNYGGGGRVPSAPGVPNIPGIGWVRGKFKRSENEVQIDWRIIDNATREIVSSGRAVGKISGNSFSFDTYQGGGFSENREFMDSALGKATMKAIDAIVEDLKKLNIGPGARAQHIEKAAADKAANLKNIKGSVQLVDGKQIWVSLGASNGFAKGDKVKIYKPVEKKNKKGEIIATTYEAVAEITLLKVQKDKSVGECGNGAEIEEDWAATDAAVDIESLE